jgi:hypothetical protein
MLLSPEEAKTSETIAARCQSNTRASMQLDKLRQQMNEQAEHLQMLVDIVHAAADGETRLAERYVAAGLLGAKQEEPGSAVLTFRCNPFQPDSTVSMSRIPTKLMLLRRLYIEPPLAPHFFLQSFYINNLEILGGPGKQRALPCDLFARRYGSPLLNVPVTSHEPAQLIVTNISDRQLDFRMLALGHWVDP